jgi:hypothetical protein
VGGHDDDRQLGVLLLHGCQQRKAVAARHPNVADQHARMLALQPPQGRIATVETGGRHPRLLQCPFQHPANGAVVIDDPDLLTLFHESIHRAHLELESAA